MSDNPTRTGIGGLAREPSEEHGPLPAEPELPDPQAQFEAFMAEVRRTLADVAAATATLPQRLDTMERAVAQLQGQNAQVELALPQHVHAINTFDARLTAMAQQISRNIRLAVLDAAVKARGVGDPSSTVMKLANEFLAFVEGGSGGPAAEEKDEPRPSNSATH